MSRSFTFTPSRWQRAQYKHLTIFDRFWEKVDASAGAFECWPWIGAISSTGYGRFTVDRRGVGAHRFALELRLGRPLTSGMYACHSCDNRGCVNPAHLFEAEPRANSIDMVNKGRHWRSQAVLNA